MDFLAEFQANGYAVVPEMLSETTISLLSNHCDDIDINSVGTRNLLSLDWSRQVAQVIADHPIVRGLLPAKSTAVQCTYFEKSIDKNWLVSLHRDLFIPVKNIIDSSAWTNWSVKEGVNFVKPPNVVLDSLLAVRIHLEENDSENGPLEVIPGTHITEKDNGPRLACLIPRGGALVMHPLLLHASSKIRMGRRRVLHYLYGPNALPDGVEWAYSVET